MHGQGGQSLIMMVTLIMGVVVAIVGAQELRLRATATALRKQAQRAYLREVKDALATAYVKDATAIDSGVTASSITVQSLLSDAGVTLHAGTNAILGAEQTGPGGISYRKIWIWTTPDGAPTTTTYDPTTNTFTPGNAVAWTMMDGLQIESRLFQQANQQMTRIATALTNMYEAELQADPFHDTAKNYWQSPGCSAAAAGEITCTNNQFMPLNQMNLAALGNQTTGVNPWGLNIQGSNTVQANQSAPPYSIVLESPTPWGAPIQTVVAEPL